MYLQVDPSPYPSGELAVDPLTLSEGFDEFFGIQTDPKGLTPMDEFEAMLGNAPVLDDVNIDFSLALDRAVADASDKEAFAAITFRMEQVREAGDMDMLRTMVASVVGAMVCSHNHATQQYADTISQTFSGGFGHQQSATIGVSAVEKLLSTARHGHQHAQDALKEEDDAKEETEDEKRKRRQKQKLENQRQAARAAAIRRHTAARKHAESVKINHIKKV